MFHSLWGIAFEVRSASSLDHVVGNVCRLLAAACRILPYAGDVSFRHLDNHFRVESMYDFYTPMGAKGYLHIISALLRVRALVHGMYTPAWSSLIAVHFGISLARQFDVVPCAMTYHLGRFEVGQVKAHLWHELNTNQIHQIITKDDGKTPFSYQAVRDCVKLLEKNKKYQGDRKVGSGAPRKTTAQQDRELVKKVFEKRGRRKATVAYLRSIFDWTDDLSDSTLEQRLHDAGMKWLRRRRKTLVAKKYIAERIAYCMKVLATKQSELNRWAFSDGTVFYLGRTFHEGCALRVRYLRRPLKS